MATIYVLGAGAVANLSTTQAGNGVTTNIAQRRFAVVPRAALLRIVTAIGATPTCTYQVEGSPDGASWAPMPTYDATGAATPSGATFAITTATTTWRIVPVDLPWTFLRITYSANTNVTNTSDLFVY